MNMSSILTSKYHIVVFVTTIIWFLSCIHRISSFSPILLSSSSLSTSSSSSSSSNTLLPVLASIKNGNDNNDDENQQTSSSSTTTNTNVTTNDTSIPTVQPQSLYLHHIAIRTRNIETAIKFYSLLGYNVEHKFRSGPARAAWLTNAFFTPPPPLSSSSLSSSSSSSTTTKKTKGQCNNIASRIELIEVPSYILNEKENTIKKAIDLIQNESLLGLNHYAIDVTPYIEYLKLNNYLSSTSSSSTTTTTTPTTSYYGLDQFLQFIESQSIKQYNKTIRIAVKPRQQVIGDQVFELAFIYDADGTIVELVRYIKDVTLKDGRTMDSGWEPWDGKGFVGLKEK